MAKIFSTFIDGLTMGAAFTESIAIGIKIGMFFLSLLFDIIVFVATVVVAISGVGEQFAQGRQNLI